MSGRIHLPEYGLVYPHREGLGQGRWRASAWAPGDLALYGDVFWADPNYASALTLDTQPLFTDADMQAIGTGAYTASNSTLSKETASPPTPGLRYLRVAWVSSNYAYAFQNALTVGARYRVQQPIRSDGAARPRVFLNSTLIATGGTTGAWENIDALGLCAGGTGLYFGQYLDSNGYTEYGGFACTNVGVTTLTPWLRTGTLSTLTLAQATLADMPWKTNVLVNGQQPVQFEGNTDYMRSSLAASVFNFLHSAAHTWFAVLKPDAPLNVAGILSSALDATSYGIIANVTAAGELRMRLCNGSGAYALDVSSAAAQIATASYNVLVGRWDGAGNYKVWNKGTLIIDQALGGAVSATNATHALDWGSIQTTTNPIAAVMGDVGTVKAAITDADVRNLGSYLASKWGVVWV